MLNKYLLFFTISFFAVIAAKAQRVPPTVTTYKAICKNSSIDLMSLITNNGSVLEKDMLWWKEGAPSGLGQNTVVKPDVLTRYTLYYIYPNGQSGSPVLVTIDVKDTPVIEPMDDVTVCANIPLQLTLKSSTYADSVWWEWLEKGTIYPNNTYVDFSTQPNNEDYEATFRVYGMNDACNKTEYKDVKVKVQIPYVLSSVKIVDEYSFCNGETVNLKDILYFSVTNNKGNETLFAQSDNVISGFNIDFPTIPNPTAYKVTGDVTLQAYLWANINIPSSCGNASHTYSNQSVLIKLKVQGTRPSLSHESVGSTNNYYPYVICKGDSAVITVSSGSCGTMDTVEWISPAIPHANRVQVSANEWKYYWKPTATTTFNARIKTRSNSSGTLESENATLTVNVKEYPKLVAISDTSACSNLNQTINLNGLLDLSLFVGSPDWKGENPVLVNPTQSKTYYVKATSSYQCQDMSSYDVEDSVRVNINNLMSVTAMPDVEICKGESVTLTATASGNIYWSKSIGGTSILENQTPTETTVYYANGLNECGLAFDSVVVTVKPLPVLQLRNDTIVCAYEPVGLYATSFNGDSILWNVNNQWVNAMNVTVRPSQTTTYTAMGYKNGCSTTTTVTVTTKTAPYLKAMDDITICIGETIELRADTDAPSVTWNVGTTMVTPISDTSYYVSATNGICTSYDTVNIRIAEPPTVTAMDDLFVCYGEMVTLTAQSSNGTISWNTPATTFRATQTAEYIVTVSNGACASASDTVVVTVNDSLYINPALLPFYKRGVQYNVQLETNADAPYYDITNGSLPTGFYLTSSGLISGIASGEGLLEKSAFKIEITDSKGCKVSKDYLLSGEVFISEVFTPNGDGFNDIFMEGHHVIIYNRLGVKLFEGEDGWNGTYQGKVMPPDTYFYTVTIVNENGGREKKSGPISIVKR